jgi:SAM-dependent methyltransferase
MIPTAYQLRAFYKTLGGRIVRRLIRDRVDDFWPSFHGLRMVGAGYAAPYLKNYIDGAERTLCLMFTTQGVHHWPDDDKNLTCLCDESDLPLETNSVDRILLIHSLEFTGFLKPAFEEFYRVLKSNGRILVVVPNRLGLWARAEWTPFGRGTPYSVAQVEDFLKENLFVPERSERALFIPPFKNQTLLRSAAWWEKFGRKICPAMGGLLLVEASKQIYAGTGKLVGSSQKRSVGMQGETVGVKGYSSLTNPKDSSG